MAEKKRIWKYIECVVWLLVGLMLIGWVTCPEQIVPEGAIVGVIGTIALYGSYKSLYCKVDKSKRDNK